MRKARLFFAIASLCMSICLFAFGVYSATMVTYTISGSVSYEVKDVLVTITTNVYKMDGYKLIKNPAVLTIQQFVDIVESHEYTSYKDGLPNESGEVDEQIQEISIDFNEATAYKITINVTTINERGVVVELGENDNFDIPEGQAFSIYDKNKNYGQPIFNTNENKEGLTFNYYVYIKDLTASIQASFNIPLIIALY